MRDRVIQKVTIAFIKLVIKISYTWLNKREKQYVFKVCIRYSISKRSVLYQSGKPLFMRLPNSTEGDHRPWQIQKELLLFLVSTAACCLMINHFRAAAWVWSKNIWNGLVHSKKVHVTATSGYFIIWGLCLEMSLRHVILYQP